LYRSFLKKNPASSPQGVFRVLLRFGEALFLSKAVLQCPEDLSSAEIEIVRGSYKRRERRINGYEE
jgi:hypothetical protein